MSQKVYWKIEMPLRKLFMSFGISCVFFMPYQQLDTVPSNAEGLDSVSSHNGRCLVDGRLESKELID